MSLIFFFSTRSLTTEFNEQKWKIFKLTFNAFYPKNDGK